MAVTVNTVEVEFQVEHEYRGKVYQPTSIVRVKPSHANLLIHKGIAKKHFAQVEKKSDQKAD